MKYEDFHEEKEQDRATCVKHASRCDSLHNIFQQNNKIKKKVITETCWRISRFINWRHNLLWGVSLSMFQVFRRFAVTTLVKILSGFHEVTPPEGELSHPALNFPLDPFPLYGKFNLVISAVCIAIPRAGPVFLHATYGSNTFRKRTAHTERRDTDRERNLSLSRLRFETCDLGGAMTLMLSMKNVDKRKRELENCYCWLHQSFYFCFICPVKGFEQTYQHSISVTWVLWGKNSKQ